MLDKVLPNFFGIHFLRLRIFLTEKGVTFHLENVEMLLPKFNIFKAFLKYNSDIWKEISFIVLAEILGNFSCKQIIQRKHRCYFTPSLVKSWIWTSFTMFKNRKGTTHTLVSAELISGFLRSSTQVQTHILLMRSFRRNTGNILQLTRHMQRVKNISHFKLF